MSKPSRRQNRQARKSVPGHRLNLDERIAQKKTSRQSS